MEETYINKNEPQNIEAEIYVLGSVIIDNGIMASLKGRVASDDFFSPFHQNLYVCMERLEKAKRNIEILTLQEMYELVGFGKKDDISEVLIAIISKVPNIAYVETYIEIIIEKSIERKLLKNLRELEKNIVNNKYEYNQILDMTETSIYEVIKERRTSDIIKINQAAEAYYDEAIKRSQTKDEVIGIDTGYELLNKYTTGFKPGEFIIIAARPSVGKTAFALNLANGIASKNERNVAFFSLEMSVGQLMQRMYCLEGNIDGNNLRTGNLNNDELVALGVALQKFNQLNIYFDEGGSNTIGDIRAKCRQLHHKNQLDIVIIDYLQLISTSDKYNRNRQEGVSEISRSLKLLARELNIPVIALSQLSRSIETREDKRPILADLRESGSLEQDADIVMFLYRREDIEPEDKSALDDDFPKKSRENDNVRSIVLKIEKNRQGSLSHVDYDFYGAQSRYVESQIQEDLIYKKKKRKINK